MSNAVYKNQAAISPSFDADVKCGTGLVLGATNDLPVPVHHTLGVELYSGSSTAASNATVTPITNGYEWDSDGTGNDASIQMNSTITFTTSDPILVTFNAVVNSGTCIIDGYYNGSTTVTLDQAHTVTDGANTIEVGSRSGSTVMAYMVCQDLTAFNIDITDISGKQITTTGYLTYETNDGVVQIGDAVDGGSSKELVIGGDFSEGLPVDFASEHCTVDTSANTGNVVSLSDRYGGIISRSKGTLKIGRWYIATVDILSYSSTGLRIGTAVNYNIITSLGTQTSVFYAEADILQFISNNDVTQTFEIDNISVKEVLPNSTTYTLVDDTYRWAYVNENPFSEADLTAIAEEPNKIVEFAMDGTGLTNTKGVDDKFYGFREPTGATVRDALSADTSVIASYAESIRTAIANSQTSIQWTCAELDSNGVPTAYNSEANTAIMHSDTSISTGFKPNIARYSIEETVTGELQGFGSNEITNSTFDTDLSGWGLDRGTITWDNGMAKLVPTGSATAYMSTQLTTTVVGKEYIIYVEIKSNSNTGVRVVVGSGAGQGNQYSGVNTSGIGVHTFEFTQPLDGFPSWVSIITEGTSLSDVLYVDNIYYIEKTTKTQRTEQRLLTHTDAHLGVEEVTNGGFELGLTSWTGRAGITTITDVGGAMKIERTADGGFSRAEQILDIASVVGATYIYSIDIVDTPTDVGDVFIYTGGTDNIVEGVNSGTPIPGTYTGIFTAINTSTEFLIGSKGMLLNDYFTVDNISLREVSTQNIYYIDGVDQSLSTYGADLFEGYGSFDNVSDFDEFIETGYGWSFDDTLGIIIRVDTAAFESHFYRGVNLIDGATYEISCDSNFVSGSAQFWSAAGTTGHDIDTPYTFVSDTTFINIGITTTDGDFNFDNLTIREVLPGIQSVSLPDPAVTINLNDTAVIGYPDTIDRRDADFKVWTTVRTDANALADYNTWVLTYKDVLTDGNDDYITDGDGRYLYTT